MIRSIPEIFAKRAIKYLLKRFFGQYLETFSHEELSLSFNKGTGTVENVSLKVETLNALCKEYNLPVDFIHGTIDTIVIEIPWSAPFTESSIIEFKGIHLVVQSQKCIEDLSMISSLWESMTSSVQLAEDCLLQKVDNDPDLEPSQPVASVEIMTKAFNTVLAKMKLKFTDTFIRLESVFDQSNVGVALEIRIKTADLYDEAGATASPIAKEGTPESDEFSSFCIKTCVIKGMELFTAQFLVSPDPIVQTFSSSLPNQLVAGSPEMPAPHNSYPVQKIEDVDIQREPILIARINGLQQVTLRLKQNDSAPGPKVDIKVGLGLINLFVTPYQVHMLIKLAHGLIKPGKATTNSSRHSKMNSNRPMEPEDFALVKQELQKHHRNLQMPSKSLQNYHGWSSRSLEESNEDFHPMPVEHKFVPDLHLVPDDLESSYNSITSERTSFVAGSPGPYEGASAKKLSKFKGSSLQNLILDSTFELTNIHVSCSNIFALILHDDMVSDSTNEEEMLLNCKTLKNYAFLKSRAEKFFHDLTELSANGMDFRDFNLNREKLSSICGSNHLRILATDVMFDFSSKANTTQHIYNANLTMHDLEVLECVYNSSTNDNLVPKASYTELISFGSKECKPKVKKTLGYDPCIKVKYDRTDALFQQRMKQPPNKLALSLAPVSFEVDISFIDRIHSLLNPTPYGQCSYPFVPEKPIMPFTFPLTNENDSSFTQCTEVQAHSSFVAVKLRFPIPDLRPLHDMERVPWWKQNLRKEALVMELSDASVSFALQDEELEQKFELQCRDFHGFMQMLPGEEPISFVRVSVDPEVEKGFDWPSLVIHRIRQTASDVYEPPHTESDDGAPKSIADILLANIKKEPSPFCDNTVFCGNKSKIGDDGVEDFDEHPIVRPADKEKTEEFIDQTINSSECVFTFYLRTVNVVLPDKKFFELVRNRLFNDLVLWQSVPLISVSNLESTVPKHTIPIGNLNPLNSEEDFQSAYSQFRVPNELNSDSASEEEEEGIVFFSLKGFNKSKRNKKLSNVAGLTKISFLLMIEKGSLLINTPVEDENGEEIGDCNGRLQLFVEECKVFTATGYKGNRDRTYTCLQSNRSSLYHNENVPVSYMKGKVQPYSRVPYPNATLIIYQSEPGVPLKSKVGCGGNSLDVMSIAIHSVNDRDQQIKTFNIAFGFSGVTLRHYMSLLSRTFVRQVISFMKIVDEPIKGYTSMTVVMEIHLNLTNCAIDYRPLYLPVKSMLTIESFSLTMNITTSASSLLRVISEELRLFLSNDMAVQRVDLKNDYACVLDTGLLDFCVRVTEEDEMDQPKFEICVSNDMIYIRTCYDSCLALQKLIIYLSENIDLNPPGSTQRRSVSVGNMYDGAAENSDVLDHAFPDNEDTVKNMMVEAMKECSISHEDGAESSPEVESDDEFCIIENDVGVGVMKPESEEPQVRMFNDGPIQMIENYFPTPSKNRDVLAAPKHFPKSILTYTMRKISITWNIHGGNDFKLPKSPAKKAASNVTKECKESDDGSCDNLGSIRMANDRISFCKVTPLTKEFNVNAIHYSMENFADKKGNDDIGGWIVKGGVNRDHKVLVELHMNKVSFSHEEYPADKDIASRDVLIIHEFEIRDKLTTSMINKMLYQYSSESMPRQTHANMIVMKAIHVRPDKNYDARECSLRISCKPLRLHIDQDTLMFLCDFFKGFTEETTNDLHCPSPVIETMTSTATSEGEAPSNEQAFVAPPPIRRVNDKANLMFFRSFLFSPGVFIKIDYNGKRVVMEQGALQGLLLGLGQLNSSEIRLKELFYRHGLLGAEKLISYALNEWINDIKNNQLPSILKGIGPLHSFVQLFQGLKDLVWMPVEQYQKDGQIVRGLQRGASSFSTSTATACIELSTLLISAIQGAAEVAYDMVSPGPSVTHRLQGSSARGRRSTQPADVREGVTTAYNVIKEGIEDTARTIVRVATIEHEHKGVQGAVGGVLRQIPPATLTPFIVGAEAACQILDGVKHQLDPDSHKEAMDKWRTKP